MREVETSTRVESVCIPIVDTVAAVAKAPLKNFISNENKKAQTGCRQVGAPSQNFRGMEETLTFRNDLVVNWEGE